MDGRPGSDRRIAIGKCSWVTHVKTCDAIVRQPLDLAGDQRSRSNQGIAIEGKQGVAPLKVSIVIGAGMRLCASHWIWRGDRRFKNDQQSERGGTTSTQRPALGCHIYIDRWPRSQRRSNKRNTIASEIFDVTKETARPTPPIAISTRGLNAWS